LIACVNGDLVAASDASVSSFDFGFLYGVGVFETFRTWNGKAVALERHLERLITSCQVLGWQVPFGKETLAEWVYATIRANRSALRYGQDLRVRITVTPGRVDPQVGWWVVRGDEPTVVIHAVALPPDFDRRHEDGWVAVIAPWRRPKELPVWQFKVTAYFAHLLAYQYARNQGAHEAIWLNTDGNLTEGTTTNLFVVHDGALWTAPTEEGLLAGIARSLVLDLADSLGWVVRVHPLPLRILQGAEEAFVTNAVIGVVPLTRLAQKPFTSSLIGKQMRSAWFAYAQQFGYPILDTYS
jgi:branched-subunit amino acid aminotransferase/4-amino-4-deoxychorismate lyase